MPGKGIFNYFQYEGTGSYESSGYIVFPITNGYLTGYFTPPDLAYAITGYVFDLLAEFLLSPPTYNVEIQGNQTSANNDKPFISLNFNGSFIPFVKESGNFSVNFYGSQTGQLKDIPSLFTNFSGNQFGQLKDISNLTIQISGDYGETMSDRPNLTISFYGSQTGQLKDIPNFFLSFTGGFQKPYKDYAYTNFSGSSILWNVGNLVQVFYFNDCANSNFKPLSIHWGPSD